jgi:retron-type reverse transcriptase
MMTAAVVMPDGARIIVREGTPQGGPLSPLLSNIVLDELDRELARRGHRFVRADECVRRWPIHTPDSTLPWMRPKEPPNASTSVKPFFICRLSVRRWR